MIDYKKAISIVLVSYKSANKISEFIKGISKEIKIIIVENSSDRKIKKIKRKNLLIIYSKNYGYGSAINLARKKIKTDYFFVFNPDVTNVNNRLLKNFYISAKELNDKFGALGPRFLNVKKKSHKQSNEKKKYGKINSISGAAIFFNTKNFDFVGGFDKNFFLYFEENDYCYRSNKKGLNIYQVNSEKIYHQIGTSVEIKTEEEASNIKKLLNWHFIWSKYYFYKKHYGIILSIFLFTPTIIRSLFKIAISKISKNSANEEKYKIRLEGLFASMSGKKSFKRLS